MQLIFGNTYGIFSVFRMAYGTEYGLVIIDIIQKICLLSVACPDLYGAHDPYSRTPKSPKRIENKEEQSRSPSSDQVSVLSLSLLCRSVVSLSVSLSVTETN